MWATVKVGESGGWMKGEARVEEGGREVWVMVWVWMRAMGLAMV